MTAVAPPAALLEEPRAHRMRLSHPRLNVQGCPWCPQPALCGWCGEPRTGDVACPDWQRHGELDRASEIRLRELTEKPVQIGVGACGGRPGRG